MYVYMHVCMYSMFICVGSSYVQRRTECSDWKDHLVQHGRNGVKVTDYKSSNSSDRIPAIQGVVA